MNKNNIEAGQAGTEEQESTTAHNQQVSQPNANTNVGRILPGKPYFPNPSWFTRMNGLNLNGQHPTEGWGIFKVDNHLEVQKIDEENKLSSDDEALKLAKRKGIRFSQTNPFEVVA